VTTSRNFAALRILSRKKLYLNLLLIFLYICYHLTYTRLLDSYLLLVELVLNYGSARKLSVVIITHPPNRFHLDSHMLGLREVKQDVVRLALTASHMQCAAVTPQERTPEVMDGEQVKNSGERLWQH